MALVPYLSPWRELEQITNRLGHVFGADWPLPADSGTWMPAVNVEETRDELVLTAEVPGMSRDELDIELENNILTIRGEKREEREEGGKEKRYHLWERRYGSFQRSFTLPRTVKPDEISAEYEDGVLTVRLPKAPEAKGRKIAIGGDGKRRIEAGKR